MRLIVVLWIVFIFNISAIYAQKPQFPITSKMYNVDSYVGLMNVSGSISAFGDFNSDKYTDLFVVNYDTVTVYLWDSSKWTFKLSFSVTVQNITQITNIVATDINHDGKLDLLIQGTNELFTGIQIVWYSGDYKTLKFESVLPSSDVQVIVFDYNSDLLPDLFGSINKVNYVWINDNKKPGNFNTQRFLIGSNINITEAHSNTFIDLNGDCLSDLIVTGEINGTFQAVIFINKNGGNWEKKATNLVLPQGAGKLLFADFDGDGNIDILFPVCYPTYDCSEENSVRIIYNRQMGVCQTPFQKNCRTDSQLCSVDDSFSFSNISSEQSADIIILKNFDEKFILFYHEGTSNVNIQFGDYDMDGNLDLLIPFKTDPGSPFTRLQLWQNVPCTETLCTKEAINAKRRTFLKTESGYTDVYSVRYAFVGVFFDIADDGTNDLIILSDEKIGEQSIFSINVYYNLIDSDSYFIKILALNGICTQWCGGTNILLSTKPYGVNQFGASIKFTFTDLYSNRLLYHISPLSQSAHLSLQKPYFLQGIGRPSNYIDYLFVGVPYKSDNPHYGYFSGVIPNSQIVVIPHPPDTPDYWVMELYLSPSGITTFVILTCIILLLIVGLLIFFLQFMEKKVDEKEIKSSEKIFSFFKTL